jgi:hypothetical protein
VSAPQKEIHIKALTHQLALVQDKSSSTLVLEGGLGSGKTFAAVLKMLSLIDDSPGVPGLWVEPTLDLIGSILLPTITEFFEQWAIPWRYATQYDGAKSVLIVHHGTRKQTIVYLRSGDKPERIVGFKVGWFILDEADSMDGAVWKRSVARVRDSRARYLQFIAVFTPEEGYNWTWDMFHARPAPGTRVIAGIPTSANIHNPSTYVSSLEGVAADEELARYLTGKRSSAKGLVYKRYDDKCNAPCVDPLNGRLIIGADFNVGKMCWVFGTLRGDKLLHIWGEHIGKDIDTIRMAEEAKEILWRVHQKHGGRDTKEYVWRRCALIPDASAGARRTSSAGLATDLQHLIDAGFDVNKPTINPPVKDRVFNVNAAFHGGYLMVDKDACPELHRCLTQQPWSKDGSEPDKTKGLDHAVDALGYAVNYCIPIDVPRGNMLRDTSRGWR